MSEKLKKYSFNDLCGQLGKIRIPKIQRDYAQGRRSQKVDEIRKVFVHTLLLVVKGKRQEAELDFVYGSNQNNAFEPLDGQQRLTTLFLLHWMMGVKLNQPGDAKHSIFTYETRNTSKEFCDELVQHDAMQYVKEAQHKKSSPSEVIKGREWFKWEWKYDATILSMLVMIDAIYDEMGTDWDMNMDMCRQNLNNITFNLLNLGQFGLSNELFIKMNARGKQLSDFDKVKSTLEEELQIQQKEKDEQNMALASAEDESTWRSHVDGEWIDLFWHKYARQIIAETEGDNPEQKKKDPIMAAKLSELQYKKLLLRLIALQLFENENTRGTLEEAAYNIDESQIDNLLFVYSDSLTELRSEESHVNVPSTSVTINFKRLIKDINLLIYQESDGTYRETSCLLPEISHIDKDSLTLFDSFLAAKVPNDVELTFYAMLLFLREFPTDKYKKTGAAWLKNLEDWVRLSRNILLNDNNNQRIDKILLSKEAARSLKQMAEDLVNYVKDNNLDLTSDAAVVKQFLISTNKTYTRLDNQSLAEERMKAMLILNDNAGWENEIDKAESHPYLWGQIRCLLNWSAEDLSLFKTYSERLRLLLDVIKADSLTFYTAMLVFAPDCWCSSNRLYLYNKDRDNSFKRYLRDSSKDTHLYGDNIKLLIDLWIESYSELTAQDFLDSLINDRKDGAPTWVKCIVKSPSILDESRNKRLFTQDGHTIMAQLKTRDSHCFDPILVYFRNLCREKGLDEKKFNLYDSKGEYEHAFLLDIDDHQYLIEWGDQAGDYNLTIDNADAPIAYAPDAIVALMEKIIDTACGA